MSVNLAPAFLWVITKSKWCY